MTGIQIRAKDHGDRHITINYDDEGTTSFLIELWDRETLSDVVNATTFNEAKKLALDWIKSEHFRALRLDDEEY